MKRSEFIRLSILSVLAIPVLELAEQLPQDKLVEIGSININGIGVKPIYKYVKLRASSEFLLDKEAFESEINQHDIEGELINTEIGWENDDFANDWFSVRLTFKN